MADSRWRVGSLTSTIAFGKSDAEVANIMEWFALDKIGQPPAGLTQAQQNQWKLDQAHREVVNYVVREAKRNRLHMLREQQANIEEQASSETSL